jgi:hypothetical protein
VLDRIQRLNGRLNADVCVNPERARKNAQKAEHEIVHGRYRGPLHGIPIALKDNIHLSCIGERWSQASVTCSGDTQAPELRMRIGRGDGTGDSFMRSHIPRHKGSTNPPTQERPGRAQLSFTIFFPDGAETCKLRDSATIPSSLIRTASLSFLRRASLSLRACSSPGLLSRVFSACSRQAKTWRSGCFCLRKNWA